MKTWRRQFCVQALLPVTAGTDAHADRRTFEEIKHRLAERHGGVTAYVQSPAEGLWRGGSGVEADRIIVLEVMVETLEHEKWSAFQAEMEERFGQEEVVVRALPIERLAD